MRYTSLLLIVLVAGGCSSVQKPTASYKSMSIANVSAEGFVMNVDVDLKNPNSFALPMTGADYSVALAGRKVVEKQKIKSEKSVPANGSTVVTIPVALTFDNLLETGEALAKSKGVIEYDLGANLNFDSGGAESMLGGVSVPFSYKGKLDVVDIVKTNATKIMGSPAAREVAKKVVGNLLGF